MKFLESLFNLFKGIAIIYLAFVFLAWYIKGHFGKYFIFFWINTFLSIAIYYNHQANIKPYDTRTGAEIWEANQRSDY
jgi:hypothetical protein